MNVCNALFPLLRDHSRSVNPSDSLISKGIVHLFFLSVVNVSSRAGMLENIQNPEIRHHLISSRATIDSIAEILNDFIRLLYDETFFISTLIHLEKLNRMFTFILVIQIVLME